MTRYARQIQLSDVGQDGQNRLQAAHVLVIGAGGLAAGVLPLLAGAGVGHLTIVDHDVVDQTNLHRQHLFTETDCGSSKAIAAAQRCTSINSDCTVNPICDRLTPTNAPELIAGADIVVDCADSYAVSYTLSDLCLTSQTPLITASVLGFTGYVAGVCGTAPSLRALFPDAPSQTATCATAGVMGPMVTALGALQAQMVLNTLLNISPSSLGQILNLDGKTWRSSGFRFDTAPEPDHGFRFVSADSLSDTDIIIDLRGPDEAPTLIHKRAKRILPNDLNDHLHPHPARLALCCASGLRAWRAAETLHPNWPDEIVLVAASAS